MMNPSSAPCRSSPRHAASRWPRSPWAWVLRNLLVSAPIVGATKPHHLPEAVDTLGLELTDEEVQELEAPYQQHGPSWY
jgi:aryl-alcohol dehydrogenase-like predicted oxidoreductase